MCFKYWLTGPSARVDPYAGISSPLPAPSSPSLVPCHEREFQCCCPWQLQICFFCKLFNPVCIDLRTIWNRETLIQKRGKEKKGIYYCASLTILTPFMLLGVLLEFVFVGIVSVLGSMLFACIIDFPCSMIWLVSCCYCHADGYKPSRCERRIQPIMENFGGKLLRKPGRWEETPMWYKLNKCIDKNCQGEKYCQSELDKLPGGRYKYKNKNLDDKIQVIVQSVTDPQPSDSSLPAAPGQERMDDTSNNNANASPHSNEKKDIENPSPPGTVNVNA
jgi:hypothetical protein